MGLQRQHFERDKNKEAESKTETGRMRATQKMSVTSWCLGDLRSIWIATLAQSPLTLAQALRVISDVDEALRNFCFESFSSSAEQWCISEFFTFAWQPTANRLPNSVSGRRLSEHWQEIQIRAAQWFISFSVCLPMCWKFHVSLIWGNKVTFWHFDYYHSENMKMPLRK